ncbi:RNA polymerase sigma factor SigZ [Paraferrimonas sp. SM1919]|uniref:RNA polymerase sigma factor SigZ n=1 Tax=Paraferrimonas sp. SM1919 TaxID=2662263 RepID=UPI0013D4E77E|nr:RNA polymerase sigma factor SigZ [Paraferrimonas sp. SM1919]
MFIDLWQQFHSQLLQFIRSKVSHSEDAEDILQEVFIKVHQSLDKLSDETKLTPWLYQICRNTIIDYYRKRKTDNDELALEQLVAPDLYDHDQDALLECVHTLVQGLSDKSQQVIELADLQRLKQQQVAEQLELSLTAVKSRLKRARQEFKQEVSKCCVIEFDEHGPQSDCDSTCGC